MGSWLEELVRLLGNAVLGLDGDKVSGLGAGDLLDKILEHEVSFRWYGFIITHEFPAKAKKERRRQSNENCLWQPVLWLHSGWGFHPRIRVSESGFGPISFLLYNVFFTRKARARDGLLAD